MFTWQQAATSPETSPSAYMLAHLKASTSVKLSGLSGTRSARERLGADLVVLRQVYGIAIAANLCQSPVTDDALAAKKRITNRIFVTLYSKFWMR